MESDTQVILAKRRWRELYLRCSAGVSIDTVLRGNSWCNPSVRFLHERVTLLASRRAWFPFGRETLLHYMEAERESYLRDDNLGIDIRNWRSPLMINRVSMWE